jgi:hypothetical protein
LINSNNILNINILQKITVGFVRKEMEDGRYMRIVGKIIAWGPWMRNRQRSKNGGIGIGIQEGLKECKTINQERQLHKRSFF